MTVSTLTLTPGATTPGVGAYAEPYPFLLGTHQPGWLTSAGVPLFVSDRRLRRYRRLPRARAPWALDSGGFTELATFGTWAHGPTPAEYVARARRYGDEIGHLAWIAPQDWMCEPVILAGTGLTAAEHQRRTVANFVQLRDLAPDLPIVPVVQGWTPGDYLRCVDRYGTAGIDLTTEPLVGVGTVCRRQGTRDAGRILHALHTAGVRRLHGFGFKTLGLIEYGDLLASADSMAWSFEARRRGQPLPGCTRHRNCANCLRYALAWRERLIATLTQRSPQLTLFARARLGGAA